MDIWIDPVDGEAVRSNVKPDIARWNGIDPAAHVLKWPIALTSTGALTAATLKAFGKCKLFCVRWEYFESCPGDVILSQVNIFDIFGHLTKLRYFGFRQHAEGLKSTLP